MPNSIEHAEIQGLSRSLEILAREAHVEGVAPVKEAGELLKTFFEVCRKRSLEPESEAIGLVKSINAIASGISEATDKNGSIKRCNAEGSKILTNAIRIACPFIAYMGTKASEEEILQYRKAFEQLKSEYNLATNVRLTEEWQTPFDDQVKKQEKTADRWLSATIGLFIITVGVAGFVAHLSLNPNPALTLGQSIQIGLGKMLLFSTSITAAIWAARNYRTTRHNVVLNQHRVNSLKTYKHIAMATKDDATRNAVLLQVANSIFTSQSSGFLIESDKLQGGSTDALHELIRLVKAN